MLLGSKNFLWSLLSVYVIKDHLKKSQRFKKIFIFVRSKFNVTQSWQPTDLRDSVCSR